MQLCGIWYLSFSDWLSSLSISPLQFSHVIVNGFISSLLMTQWCRSVYIYHIFLPIHLSMDIWAVSTVWLLLIMLLQTLGCMSLFESKRLLLYPRDKYLAVQFWNHRVLLLLTSWGPSTLFCTVAAADLMLTRSIRGLPLLHSLTNTCCFLCCLF